MAVTAHQIYQSDEWTTHRPTVAQAFDTLDRLRLLCVESMPEGAAASAMPAIASDMSRHVLHPRQAQRMATQENLVMVLAALAGLADDLAGELDAVAAELSPYLRHDAAQHWLAFEMQTHMNAMRETIQEEREADDPSIIVLDDIMIYAERIEALLKHIDQ